VPSGAIPGSPLAGRKPFDWVTLFPDRDSGIRPQPGLLPGARPVTGPRPARRSVYRGLLPTRVGGRPRLGKAVGTADRADVGESSDRPSPRVWWKEAIKRHRVRRFSAALVGGPRHRDYLIELGMPADRIAAGLQRRR